MRSLHPARFVVLMIIVPLIAGCVEDEQLSDLSASGEAAVTTSEVASPTTVTPTSQDVTTTTGPTPTVTTIPSTTETTLIPPNATFCEALETFFEAWALFLQPADLTPAYEALGDLAPPELVDEFAILATGNDILVATKDRDALPDPDGYDASGQRVGTYAMQECGIDPEEFERD